MNIFLTLADLEAAYNTSHSISSFATNSAQRRIFLCVSSKSSWTTCQSNVDTTALPCLRKSALSVPFIYSIFEKGA